MTLRLFPRQEVSVYSALLASIADTSLQRLFGGVFFAPTY